MKTKIRYVDLFAGCGGLSYGFQKNDAYEHVVATDIWQAAKDTYDINFPNSNYILADLGAKSGLQQIITEIPKNLDLLIGGPPCVGFSTLNNSKTESRFNTLVDQYLNVIEARLPKIFILENVKTFRTKKHPSGVCYPEHLKKRIGSFQKGYTFLELLINAADFGLAQSRIRYFFIGIRKDCDKKNKMADLLLSEIENQKKEKPSTLKDAIGDLPNVPVGAGANLLELPDGTKIYNHKSMNHSATLIERLKHVPKGGGLLDVPSTLLTGHLKGIVSGKYGSGGFVKNIYGRMEWDKPSGTIIAGMDKITCGRFVHPEEHRLLTPRECARIQSFPDDFVFTGGIVTQYYLIGNAVPPKISNIFSSILPKLFEFPTITKSKLLTCN